MLNVAETRYWRIFNVLKNDRIITGELSPRIGNISSSSIIDYALRVDRISDAREIDRTVRMVQAIDAEYVAVINKGLKRS